MAKKYKENYYESEEIKDTIGLFLDEEAGGYYIKFSIDTDDAPEAYTTQDGWVVLDEVRPVDYWIMGDKT